MDKKSKILVTGSGGFVGSVLCRELRERGYENVVTFSSAEYDITKEGDVAKLFLQEGKFDVVLHMAAVVKGIKFRKENPRTMFYDNLMMNSLMQEYSMESGVSKFVGLGSITAYAGDASIPYVEEEYLKGEPEETNLAYAIAKRVMLQQGLTYRKQNGFNAIHLIMTNMYGPGYDVNSDELYVIPAMIKKFNEAKESKKDRVNLWGSGKACREFLYVGDAVNAIILAMENYDSPEPLNIGTGVETSIKEIAEKISEHIGFGGKIEWDVSKPEGKMRNSSRVSRAEEMMGFRAGVSLDDGLKKTIEWYEGMEG